MKSVLLVDVSNIYYCLIKQYNAKLDYAKLLDFLAEKGYHVVTKIAYTTGSDGQSVFLSTLEHLGFEIKTKPSETNLDSDIVFDAIKYSKEHEAVILASGDGDFAPCLEALRERNKIVIIGSNLSGKLKLQAHEAYEITGNLLYQYQVQG